jgi:hypothetical protein
MHTLQRIWNEIRRGENIEVYLTIILAAGLSIATITGDYSPSNETLTAILLGILALLAITNLKGRHALEQLSEKLSDSIKPAFLEEFPPSLNEDIISASELWLIGVSLSRTIRNNFSELERKLQKGHKIKFLLVNPDGHASEIAATRPYPRTEVEQTRRQIRDSLDYLCKLKAVSAKNFEVRTIENPLTHGIIAINPDSSLGTFYIEEYPYQTMGSVLPRFILRAKDRHWYDFYKSELRNLWNSGVEWKCASSEKDKNA